MSNLTSIKDIGSLKDHLGEPLGPSDWVTITQEMINQFADVTGDRQWIHIDVEDENGQVLTWAIECGAPNALMRRGLNKNSVPVGTELVIDGFQAKDGSNTANARDITLPDGSTFFVGSSGTGAPYDRPR